MSDHCIIELVERVGESCVMRGFALHHNGFPRRATQEHELQGGTLMIVNKNMKTSSFKSSENIQKKEGGPDRSVSDNQSSSATLNELAMKAKITNCNFEFQQISQTKTNINPNVVQITKTV